MTGSALSQVTGLLAFDTPGAGLYDITDRIESLLGRRVAECNITVDDIYFPHEERQPQR